ncbi:PA14 domain-containing protein [Nannocystaceae bacterium ST9]
MQDRPGWSSLIAAANQLHAAEMLIGDPVGDPGTARVHLRRFWASAHEAARAAGQTKSADVGAWLASAELPGLSPTRKTRCQTQWTRWVGRDDEDSTPARAVLRAHAADAREVIVALEPIVGGVALKQRRWRIAAGIVTAALILGPAAIYQAATKVIPGQGPWRGAYYPDRELESEPVLRRDLDVDFDFGIRGPMDEIPPDKFSIRWDTCMTLDEPTQAVFQLKANDGSRFYVDGELWIDAWDRQPKTQVRGFGSAVVDLDAGVHHLRVEMFESLGGASAVLVASLDGGVPKSIPYQILTYPGDDFDEADPCAAAR